MKEILTGFEPLSEGKSAYLSCFCRRTPAKQIRSAVGSRRSSARGGTGSDERRERGREKVQLSLHTSSHFFFLLLLIFIFLLVVEEKKQLLSTIMVFQSPFVLEQLSVQARGWKSRDGQSERGTTGSVVTFGKHFKKR